MPLVAIGILFSLVGAMVFGLTFLKANDRQAVLTLRTGVEPGETISASDLQIARVATDESIQSIQASDAASVVGKKATVALAPGSLLTRAQVGDARAVPTGKAVVGLALKPGQMPPNLSAGDRVIVVATKTADPGVDSQGASLTVPDASVFEVSSTPDPSGSTVLSVLVPAIDAPELATAAAGGEVSVVLVGPS